MKVVAFGFRVLFLCESTITFSVLGTKQLASGFNTRVKVSKCLVIGGHIMPTGVSKPYNHSP